MNKLKEITRANKTAYDVLAKEYSNDARAHEKITRKYISNFSNRVKEVFPERKSHEIKVLDIGVGSGLVLKIFEEQGFETFGIDVSGKMIKEAGRLATKSKFIEADFLEYTFDNKFSGIIASAFIHLFPKSESQKIIARIVDCLEEGGIALINTTLNEKNSEGWEEKKDYQQKVKRYRSRWTKKDFDKLFSQRKGFSIYHIGDLIDFKGKHWYGVTIRKNERT